MQYRRGGKKSKRFSPGSNFTEQIFTGEPFRGGFSRGTETGCLKRLLSGPTSRLK